MDPTIFKRLVGILLYLTTTRLGLASLGNTMEVVVDIVATERRETILNNYFKFESGFL